MTRFLCLAALSSLAFCAHAQASQYPTVIVYERAEREPHDAAYTGSPVHYQFDALGNGSFYCNASDTNFFTVTGSLAQGSLPWGTTWKNLTDPNTDHWTYSETVTGIWTPGKPVTIMEDYYTIDGDYSEPDPKGTPDPNDPTKVKRINQDPNNGHDDLRKDGPPYNASWTRICTSQVTNDFFVAVSG